MLFSNGLVTLANMTESCRSVIKMNSKYFMQKQSSGGVL